MIMTSKRALFEENITDSSVKQKGVNIDYHIQHIHDIVYYFNCDDPEPLTADSGTFNQVSQKKIEGLQ